MRLENMNFAFNIQSRITNEQLDLLNRYFTRVGNKKSQVAIYGFAEAGVKVYENLINNQSMDIVGCFDMRYKELESDVEVLSPLEMKKVFGLDYVINTTPPAYIIDVAEIVCSYTPPKLFLSLYEPYSYLDNLDNYHYKLLANLSRKRDVPKNIQDYSEELRDHLLKSFAQWHSSSIMKTRKLVSNYDSLLVKAGETLGDYLDKRLQKCLPQAGSEDVDALIRLAEEFPFFALARDAAACTLVQRQHYDAAVSVFQPVLHYFPYCHHTHVKFAELNLLAGNLEEARRAGAKAMKLAPGYIGTVSDYSFISGEDREIIEKKWSSRAVRPRPVAKERLKIRIASPVWGKKYIELFMKTTVASLLATGNIPYAAKNHDVCYALYSSENDFDYIQSFAAWQAISERVPIELISIESVQRNSCGERGDKYASMSLYHSDVLRRSQADGHYSFLTLGDFLFSSEFLKNTISYALNGYETIFFHSTRFCYDEMMRIFYSKYIKDEVIEISASQLLVEALPHLHPSQLNYLNRNDLPYVPNTYYTKNKHNDLITHVFCRTPLFLAPMRDSTQCLYALDADLPYIATDGGLRPFYVVKDTSEMAFLELTPKCRDTDTHTAGTPCDKAYAAWIFNNTDPLSRYFGTYSFIFKNGASENNFDKDQLELACRVNTLI